MDPAAALASLRSALELAIAGSPYSVRDLSRRLGRHPEYLNRALAGHLELRFREAAQVLALLGTGAEDFFDRVFPFGDLGQSAPRHQAGRGARGPDDISRWVLEGPIRTGPPPTPAELAARAGVVLRGMIRRKGLTQRGISRDLGLSENTLGHSLRGSPQLTFRHVFGILAELDTEPGRFFAELSGPAPPDVAAHLRWLRYLDATEERFVEAARESAARQRAGERKGKAWVAPPDHARGRGPTR